MIEITANEIKTRGVTAIDSVWNNGDDAVITVKGKMKYAVVSMEKYNRLREFELEQALAEAKSDFAGGRYYTGIPEHLKRISDV